MHSKISHTLVLCASFCIATGAVAESADDVFIEEIVVTATHRETALMDTPQAISAVSGELIEQLGYIDMKDLFKNIPGLNMTEGSSSSNNRYVVRGVSSQSGLESYQQTSAAISVYLDDIPMTSAQGPARQFAGNLFDIDRVEVLKGPQGTLFGEGSVGGTIRFIQNDPQLNTTSFKLKAGVNSVQDSDDLGNRIDGMFNFPLGDNAAVRLTAFHDETAGYIDKLNTFEDDVNTETADGGRLAVLWAPNDRLTLDATIYYSKMETEGAVLAQRPYEEEQNIRIPGVAPFSEEEIDIYSFNVEYEFDFATLQTFASYMDRESVSQSENPQSVASVFDWFIQFNVFARGDLTPIEVAPGFFIPLLFLDPTSEFNMMAAEGWIFSAFDACSLTCVSNQNAFNNNSTARSERTVFEARLLSKDDGAFRWTAGAFYKQSDDFRQDRQPFLMFPFLDNATLTQSVYADFYADPSNVHLDDFEELSFYGEASYAFNDQWEVTVGARYTDMEQALEESTTATEDQVVSPKLGLAWRPIEGTLVYFNYTTGFRPGNLNLGQEFNARQLAGAGDTVIPATPLTANPLNLTGNEAAALATSRITYDGDTVDNYELGIKTRLWDNRINLTASIYYFDWEDTILAFQETNLPTINQQYNDNAGAAHTQGIELEVVARLTDRFTVRVGGDFNESELDDDFGAVPSGTDLPYAPEWSAALTLDYAIPLGGGWEGKATLNQTWLAKQTRSLNETLTLPQRRQTDLRFSLGDPSNQWLATLFVTNLTDEDKVVIDGTSALFGTNVFVFQAPRMIGLEVTYDFAAQ